MLTRMYLYSTSTKLSIDVWLYLDRPGSLSLFGDQLPIYHDQSAWLHGSLAASRADLPMRYVEVLHSDQWLESMASIG